MDGTPISLDAAKKSVERIGPKPDPEFTPITAEEKLEHKHRLEGEGRSAAFAVRREEIRHELRRHRVAKPLAVEKSWRQALEEFPPLPVKEELKEQEEPPLTAETIERFEATSSDIDIKRDIKEAYGKAAKKGLSANQFDRQGGYLFYRFARDSPLKFLELVVRHLGKLDDEDGPEKLDERDVKLDDLIAKMEREVPAERKCPKCKAMIPE